jgi:hypothetical protein
MMNTINDKIDVDEIGEPTNMQSITSPISRSAILHVPRTPETKEGVNYKYVSRWNENSTVLTYDSGNTIHKNSSFEMLPDTHGTLIDDEVFSGATNIKLELEIEKLEERLKLAESEKVEQYERMKAMEAHHEQVQQEIKYSNDIVNAKKNEIDTEKHIIAIASRSAGHYQFELKSHKQGLFQAKELFNTCKHQTFKTEEEIKLLQTTLNWSTEGLNKWAHALAKKDSDFVFLQKHSKLDNTKIEVLNMHIEKLNTSILRDSTQVNNRTTELQAAELDLDAIEGNFNKLHADRTLLVNQWRDTIQNMEQRDSEIQKAAMKQGKSKTMKYQQNIQLLEEKSKTELLSASIVPLKKMIMDLGKDILMKNDALGNTKSVQTALSGELTSCIGDYESLLVSNKTAKEENDISKKTIEQRCDQIIASKARLEEGKSNFKEQKESVMSDEVEAKQREKMLHQKNSVLKRTENELNVLKQDVFNEEHQFHRVLENEAMKIMLINNLQSTKRNQKDAIQLLSKDIKCQEEKLHNADYVLHQVKCKVDRGLGVRSTDEKMQLLQTIIDCEAMHKNLLKESNCVMQQIQKVTKEGTMWMSSYNEEMKIEQDIKEAQTEALLDIYSNERSAKSLEHDINESVMENDRLSLDVKTLRERLCALMHNTCILKKCLEGIDQSAKEEYIRVCAAGTSKNSFIKTADSECSKNIKFLNEKKAEVKRIQMRCDGLSASKILQSSNEFDSVQAAEHRQAELLKEGDITFLKKQELEEQIVSTQHLLQKIQRKNTQYRSSLLKSK